MSHKIFASILSILLSLATFAAAQTNYARMISGVNAQTGTSYTLVAADTTRVVTFNNASPVAVTLPNGSNNGFGAGRVFMLINLGSGLVTVTCSGCTVNGSTTIQLSTGQSAEIYGDGTNFAALVTSSSGTTPGGSPTQVQFNNSGSLGGITNVAAGSFLASQGASSTPVFQPKMILDARDYSGADWCAQVNAANTAAGSNTAEIYVPSALSGATACTTSISLSSNRRLIFGEGTFNLGTQTSRAGIVIGAAVNNVSILGAGIGNSILKYTSANTGAGNSFPSGSAISIGRVSGCANDAAASHYIYISGLTIQDLNAGSAIASAFNPSGITGACASFVVIENNEFTDNKGNGAITITGLFGSGGGDTYVDRNNIFDGTVAGGGGEFTGDNSSNWTHYEVSGNQFSRWPCAVGVARVIDGQIRDNIVDGTLKSPFSGCSLIGLGAGSDTSGTLGPLKAVNNVVTMGFSGVGIGMFPNSTINSTSQLEVSNNIIENISGSSTTGISINGADATHTPPAQIVRGNTLKVDFPTAVGGRLANVEMSSNIIETTSNNIDIFNCAIGTVSIISGSVVRVFDNRSKGTGGTSVARQFCADASFSGRGFQEWNNTLGNGLPSSNTTVGAALGTPALVTWTPGTIAAYTSTGTQTAAIAQTAIGDQVRITNVNSGTSTYLTMPPGVVISGAVTASGTVSFNITNTTASPVTINSGNPIDSLVLVDRLPYNAENPYFSLNGAAAHTTISASGQVTSTLSTGTAPFVIASTTPVANLTTVPTTYNHSGTQQTATHLVRDRCTLGTDCSVTLAGSAVFTSSSTYDCVAIDRTGANAVQFSPSSGSAFALTGTGTDTVSYVCVGN